MDMYSQSLDEQQPEYYAPHHPKEEAELHDWWKWRKVFGYKAEGTMPLDTRGWTRALCMRKMMTSWREVNMPVESRSPIAEGEKFWQRTRVPVKGLNNEEIVSYYDYVLVPDHEVEPTYSDRIEYQYDISMMDEQNASGCMISTQFARRWRQQAGREHEGYFPCFFYPGLDGTNRDIMDDPPHLHHWSSTKSYYSSECPFDKNIPFSILMKARFPDRIDRRVPEPPSGSPKATIVPSGTESDSSIARSARPWRLIVCLKDLLPGTPTPPL